jgi:hypothetical protein
VRGRYEPSRFSGRFWLLVAAGLWILVKLPQEYWIHGAQLDFTDAVRDYPAFGVAVLVALAVAALVVVFVVLPRLPAADWRWRLRSDTPAAAAPRPVRVLGREAFEKVSLLTLLCVNFASILPGIDATVGQVAVSVTVIVLANAAISYWHRPLGLAALLATNLALVWLGKAMLGDRQDFDLGYGFFFAFLITVIIWLYDAFRPAYDSRHA